MRQMTLTTTREDHLVAALAALAIVIHIAESALPMPLPGVKPGLANVITVAALLLYGWRVALWVGLLRVLVGSIVIGTFLSPTFILSLSGASAALAVICLMRALAPGAFGPVGYCLAAAVAHMAAQFFTAYALFIPHPALFGLLPVLMTVAVCFGLLSGIIVHATMTQLRTVHTP